MSNIIRINRKIKRIHDSINISRPKKLQKIHWNVLELVSKFVKQLWMVYQVDLRVLNQKFFKQKLVFDFEATPDCGDPGLAQLEG